MTLHIVDVSRYQVERSNPLDLTRARLAGFNAINVQLDRGRGDDVLSPWALTYVREARDLGMGVCTYRWLDSRLGGAESARRAYDRIVALGGLRNMAHAVDCEDNASEEQLQAYVKTMRGLLGRPIAIYTGAWWMRPRGWNIRSLTPYLWAAPVAGYQPNYPGDTSVHWSVNYGGHTALDVMQYSVAKIPGTGDCSLSAIRDLKVWRALIGSTQNGGASMSYADPALITARNYLIGLGVPANAVGIVGDQSHQSEGGYHVGNDVLAAIGRLDTDYSKRQSSRDRPGSNAAMALDIGGLSGQTLYELTAFLIAQCRAGAPDAADIREVIGRETPAGGIVRYDRLGLQFGEPAGHDTHTHISYFRDSEGRDKTALLRRFFQPAPTNVRRASVILYTKQGTTPALYAVAGLSPGTPANWHETTDYNGLAVPWAQRFGNAVALSPGTWDQYKSDFLSPLTVVTPDPDPGP